jgi:hypothetical protein
VNSILRQTARVAVVVALLSTSVWTVFQPSLDEAVKRREEAVTEVVRKGPVAVDEIQWTLDSLRIYSRLADADGEKIDLDVPPGAVIVVAMLGVKPLAGLKMNNGFTCDAELIDDENNVWKAADSIFGTAVPTYCGDDDHPIKRGQTGKVMKVFVVPRSSVPKLLGVITPPTGEGGYPEKRVLIRP